jgi:hypothetical protein
MRTLPGSPLAASAGSRKIPDTPRPCR